MEKDPLTGDYYFFDNRMLRFSYYHGESGWSYIEEETNNVYPKRFWPNRKYIIYYDIHKEFSIGDFVIPTEKLRVAIINHLYPGPSKDHLRKNLDFCGHVVDIPNEIHIVIEGLNTKEHYHVLAWCFVSMAQQQAVSAVSHRI